jgi:hypothetical protein
VAETLPVSRAHIDPAFEAILEDIQEQAAAEVSGRSVGDQVLWARPAAWDGNVYDLSAFSAPFARDASNADYVSAVEDPDNPGVTGDLVVSTIQIDFLATQERAYRNRHTMRRPRAVAHVLARLQGHASPVGPIGGMLDYVRVLLQRAKEPPL